MWFILWFLIIRGEVTMILPPIGSYICDLRLTCCRKIIIVDGGGVAPYTYIVYIFILQSCSRLQQQQQQGDDDGSCIQCSAPQKRWEVIAPMTVAVAVAAVLCIDVADFLPKRSQYFCVCVRLCTFVCTSISHAEGREYYYFDLLHPPPINECLVFSLFRAVRRTRHVIVPPQHH